MSAAKKCGSGEPPYTIGGLIFFSKPYTSGPTTIAIAPPTSPNLSLPSSATKAIITGATDHVEQSQTPAGNCERSLQFWLRAP